MSKSKQLVPKLRFPEFIKIGAWVYKKGNLVFEQISNKQHNCDLPILAITQEYGAVPRKKIDYHVTVTEKSIESYKVVETGDFIISLRSFQGGIEYSKYKGICSPAYIILRNKIEIIDDFFKQYFKAGVFIQHLNRNIEGIRDGKMVSYKQFSDILLPVPSHKEQAKIAACLSSLDELITAQNQKLEAFKKYKKGLMQQLFPEEGETVPKLRFSEFVDSWEWESKKLGNIASFFKGKGISKADVVNDGKLLCIRYGELYTYYNEVIENIVSSTNISVEQLVLSNTNDVIIPASGETHNDIATASCVKKSGVALGGDLNIIRSNNDGIFLSYYLNSVKKYEIAQMAQGISVIHLYASQLKTLNIKVPSLVEQTKIADCLSSLDERITAQAKKIEALKTHKKGLMQQLFPVVVEGETKTDEFMMPSPTPIVKQTKIADCLSSLDERITAQNQKKEVFKKRKKGLMQQLTVDEIT